MPNPPPRPEEWIDTLLDRRRSELRITVPQTLVMRAKGFVSRWRILDEHLVVFPLASEVVAETTAGTLRLGPGDCAWIPAGMRHRMRQPRPRTQYRLRFQLLVAGEQVPLPGGPWARHGAWDLRPLLEMAHLDLLRDEADRDRRWRCLLALLLSRLAAPETPTAPLRPGHGMLSAGQRAALEQRWAGWRTLGIPDPHELARAAGLGSDWFGRAFTRTYGIPPRRWLADRRLDLAAELLVTSDRPAGAVAAWLRWSQYAQFARQFRARFGRTPERWRQERVPPQRGA